MVFVGDLADRGSDNVGGLRKVASAVRAGRALTVLGNHDDALLRRLQGSDTSPEPGGEETWSEIEAQTDAAALKAELIRLLQGAPLVLELAAGELVVAHAGVSEEILRHGLSGDAGRLILHGDEIGTSPEGRTMRRDWAADYRGWPFIVYGHTPQPIAVIRGRTANIDTGAYRGNALSALRWPEMEIVSVPAPIQPSPQVSS